MLYSSDFRRRPPANNRTCDTRWGDLRHKIGNQHNQRGRPATPSWQTCDAICFTAAISVAGPQQRIGPATPEWQTGDPGVRDQRRRRGRPATPEGETCDTRLETSITRGADLRRQRESRHYQVGKTCDTVGRDLRRVI